MASKIYSLDDMYMTCCVFKEQQLQWVRSRSGRGIVTWLQSEDSCGGVRGVRLRA